MKRNNSSNSKAKSSSLVCDHRPALKEMAQEQSLVTQLRAIVLPALQEDERCEVVAQLLQSILDCSTKAIAALKLHQFDAPADDDAIMVAIDDKKRVNKFSDDCIKEDDVKPHRQHKRRRLAGDCVILETPVPHYDGHQWRKYGQKHINNAKHPRSYFRCTYRQEQGCVATKTVQQQDEHSTGSAAADDDPVMYAVMYYGQHTCNGEAVETASTQSSGGGRDGSQCSISVTCSVVVNHQQTTSLESELLGMADSTTEVNKYEMFNMASYAPLDFDSWEMDAHGHGLVGFGDW